MYPMPQQYNQIQNGAIVPSVPYPMQGVNPYQSATPVSTGNYSPVQPAPVTNPSLSGGYTQYPYPPMPYYAPYYMPPPQPQASVGAVQIYIQNPTVNANGQQPNVIQPGIPVQQPGFVQSPPQTSPPVPQSPSPGEQPTSMVGVLPNAYIKTLENYLNSPNKELRSQALREITEKFKEDPSRKDSKQLINLLNKAMQDPDQGIRLRAMGVVDAGYTNGNDFTIELLQRMQNEQKPGVTGDSESAANVLLKIAGRKAGKQNVPAVPSNEPPPPPPQMPQPPQLPQMPQAA